MRVALLAAVSFAIVLLLSTGLPSRVMAESMVDEPAPSVAAVQLRLGEMATLADGALILTFVQVDEDSRCPRGVRCFWEGRVVARLHVVQDGEDRGEVQVAFPPGPGPGSAIPEATVGRYVIELAALDPYPVAEQPTAPDQYLATVRVRPS